MTIESILDTARNDVLIENTGQTVLKHLRALEDRRSLVMSRWIWELLQNARDAGAGRSLSVSIVAASGTLSISHNGKPFAAREIAHLIYHGSTKQDAEGPVRFGTGFISTHLISPDVTVRGALADSDQAFEFLLSRRGSTAADLSSAMNASWESFQSSLGNCPGLEPPTTTQFCYEIDDDATRQVVDAGIASLLACAPYVLAFNPVFDFIEVTSDGQLRRIRRLSETAAGNEGRLIECVLDSEGVTASRVTVVVQERAATQVAFCLHRGEDDKRLIVQDNGDVPKLFLAFPLNGTSDFAFPMVVNCEEFTPTEERDGIPLGTAESDANEQNKAALENAVQAFAAILGTAVELGWGGLDFLARIPAAGEKAWLNLEWLSSLQRRLLDEIVAQPVVETLSGTRILPEDAWLPVEDEDRVWDLVAALQAGPTRVPPRDVAPRWADCVRSWAAVLDADVNTIAGALTVEKLANWVAELGSVDALKAQLTEPEAAMKWLESFLALVCERRHTHLLDDLELLPNQNGEFKGRSKVRRDPGIDIELKDIAEGLNIPARDRLLHAEIANATLQELLDEESEEALLDQLLQRVKEKSQPPFIAGYVEANVRLFRWLAEQLLETREERADLDKFDGFPVLCVEPNTTLALDRDEDSDAVPLAPVLAWEPKQQDFAALFPRRFVVDERYFAACPSQALWESLSSSGFIRLSPIYRGEEYITRFYPDEPLPDLESGDEHQSEQRCSTVKIAFLTYQDIGILDVVRSSATKAALLLRFMTDVVCGGTDAGLVPIPTICSCGSPHRFFEAEWITMLRDRHWIPLGGRRSAKPDANAIATLLQNIEGGVGLLRHQAFGSFVTALGISVADVTVRAIARSEDERTALVMAFTGLVQAAGGDVDKVSVLVDELREKPELIQEIEERQIVRRRIAANKSIGELVETLLRAALKGAGLEVRRTGVGSDYEVMNDVVDGDAETWFAIGNTTNRVLVEVKATTVDSVRMTRQQAQTAERERDGFALCVVELPEDGQPDAAHVEATARFVVNIGSTLAPLCAALDSIESFRSMAPLVVGALEVILTEGPVRFKVGASLWRNERTLQQFVDYVMNQA